MWAQVVNIVLGLFLMVAPAIWPFDKMESHHHYIIGPLIITFGITALWEVNRNTRWMNVLFGIWLLLSPFVLGTRGLVAKIDIFIGILLIVFSLFKGTITQRYGGGWQSLFQKNPAHLQEAENSQS